ncbi:MAG: hypothetical protein LBN74_00835 [Prevotella sp.]|jgi:hypothetical protein|nr:hypothetical protein [Prevotella sp.]
MNWSTELPFILNGVDGDLKIVYTPLIQKFYQNGREVKKSGSGFGGQKYKLETTDGGDNTATVKSNLKNGKQIVFRGETINLETSLSGLTTALSVLPFVSIALAAILFVSGLGVIGAALLGATGALGMLTTANALRQEKDLTKQVLYSVVISLVSAVVFVALLMILSLIFGTIFGIAFSLS